MDFASAEYLLNMAYLHGKISMVVLGDNGIGKTQLIAHMADNFKKSCVMISEIDYGGIRKNIPVLSHEKKKTISISDMANIIYRKQGVRDGVLMALSSLTDEGIDFSLTMEGHPGNGKRYKMNVVVGMTYHHLTQMFNMRKLDFLDRIMILPVQRDMKGVDMKKKFQLPYKPYKKYDYKVYKTFDKGLKVEGMNARHANMMNELFREHTAMVEQQPLNFQDIVLFDTDKAMQAMYRNELDIRKFLITPKVIGYE